MLKTVLGGVLAASALVSAMPAFAAISEVEFEPGVTDCRLAYRRPMSKLEIRPADGVWQEIPLCEKSPVESRFWRGTIRGLKAGQRYELRAKPSQGRVIVCGFSTQPEIPRRILRLKPTFENCSFELPDHEGKACTAEYRAVGGSWRQAPPPVWFPDERCWRGAFLQLRENTEYEVRLKLPDQEITGSFRTWDPDLPVARTIVIPRLPFRITESGKPGAYVRYVAEKPLKGHLKLEGLRYVILDGLKLDCDRSFAGLHLDKCSHVAVRNCDISNFGSPAFRSWDPAAFGRVMPKPPVKSLYGGGGLRISECENVLIERCFFHHPSTGANSWYYSHPTGSEAIVMDCAKGGVVIRYNDFAASDLLRWDDPVTGIGNGCNNGGFGENGDVYGNYFVFSNDDACELEGAGRNLRFYRNRIEQTYAGVSTGRCSFGPVYIFRNLLVNAGDQHGHFGPMLKNGMQIQGKGTVFFLYNTIAAAHGGPSWIFHSFHSARPIIPLPKYKGVSRGNVFCGRQNVFPDNFFLWPGDYDRDVFSFGSQDFRDFLNRNGQEKNALWGNVRFVDPARGIYTLAEGSCGRNFAEKGFLEGVRHAGACQEKDVHALLGRKLFFTADAAYASTSGKELSFTVRAVADTPFRVVTNDDFFTVHPMSGTLKAGVSQTFTVRADAEKTPLRRIYRGVFFIRRDDGFSLPLGFAFDRRNNSVSGMEIPNGGVVTLPAADAWFIFLKGTSWNGQGVLEVGRRKFEVRLQPYLRDGVEIIRLCDRKTGNLLRLQLEPGSYRIRMEGDQKSRLKVRSVIITREPDLIFNGRLQEEGI